MFLWILILRMLLVDGLKTLGVAEAIEKDPDVLKPLFVGGPKALEVQDLLDLFSPCFSPPGSNRRRQENQALMFWKDWLIEVDGTRPVTLEQMLIFASGIDCIPPLGFPNHPTIQFLHDSNGYRRIFPEANTCEVILRLPLHPSYSIFTEYMESGILQSPTFGLF
uniref:HECT domain-containing protein n=1 Tax=Sparus aurata TaxID=8175 RepID=A0A671XEA4_SPAAU